MTDQLSIRVTSQRNGLIALGSNLAYHDTPPKEILAQSLDLLEGMGLEVAAVSALYRTPAFPAGSGPDFVNAAARCETNLSPGDVLRALHDTETRFGRSRQARWAARALDIDLLAYGDMIVPDRATFESWRDLPHDRQQKEAPGGLVLPHPRMHERGFVLVPLADVAPTWRHPVIGKSVTEMLAALPKSETEGIQRL
ncbi:MAG: 2-amino-4-hydroxy-6-hydroxymethyldihydropteridine diphosphokinase [Pseudomonadota bacterium]